MPTYQRAAQVVRVLAPLLADPAVGEVVVVVDGSADDTLARLEALAARDPRLRPLWRANSGAGAARQAGVQAARGEVVLLLDDDVLALPGLAAGHLAEHRRDPGRVVVGSMPTAHVGRRRAADATTLLYAEAYAHACAEYVARPQELLDHFWSGNVSMPRELALAVGLGDPELADLFPMEDLELGLRLRAAGTRAAFVPSLAAVHLHTRSLSRFTDDSRRQGRAQQVLHRRHPDDVPEPTGRRLAGRLPPPVRWLVTGAERSTAVAAVATALCLAGVRLAGALRLWPLQDIALVVLQRVCQAGSAGAWARA